MLHILTLTWNGLDKLQRLKPGLINNIQQLPFFVQWLIRDNGSTDGTLEEITTWVPCKTLYVDHNRDNFAKGVNSLANLATMNPSFNLEEDYFLLLNNDVEFPEEDSVTKMYECFQKHAQVGAVGARLCYKGTNKLQHAGVIFGKRYNNLPYHYRHQEESDPNAEKNRYFQAVTAAVCMIRAKDFLDLGGLDEGFVWAFEDIDFMLRLGQAGKKIIYCGETKIFHEESASLKKNPVNKLFVNNNVQRFRSKWNGKYDLDHEKYLKNPDFNVTS